MSRDLVLVQNHNLSVMGHIFCGDCATELNVVLIGHEVYLNPEYKFGWEQPWHEFHNVKTIFPALLQTIWDCDFHASCPCCGNKNPLTLSPMDNSLFDLRLVKRSLDTDTLYVCMNCEGEFASHECVVRTGDNYICGDCAAHAMR